MCVNQVESFFVGGGGTQAVTALAKRDPFTLSLVSFLTKEGSYFKIAFWHETSRPHHLHVLSSPGTGLLSKELSFLVVSNLGVRGPRGTELSWFPGFSRSQRKHAVLKGKKIITSPYWYFCLPIDVSVSTLSLSLKMWVPKAINILICIIPLDA